MKEEISFPKFYYPYCMEKGCDGVLQININEDFSVDFECDKNEKHKKKRIFFKTFERFYLKEKIIEKCLNCDSNLESDKYKCIKCQKMYCCFCFISDEHIKKDINNLLITNKKCPTHKKEFIQYCSECKKYLCAYCTKDNGDNYLHKNHDIICLIDLIPSENDINSLRNKINQRTKKYQELMESLDEWKEKVFNKIEQLKKNLRYEIELMKKLFFNYNKYFINYTYFKNFEYFIHKINNRSSNKFNKCYCFDDFKNILELLFTNKKNEEFKNKNLYLKYKYKLTEGIIKKINDDHFFVYSYNTDEVKLIKVSDEGVFETLEKTKIDFNRKIYSVSLSIQKNKIYACLTNSRIIKIFNLDIENKLMEESPYNIDDNENNSDGKFYKCIEISEDIIAAGDRNSISIWKNSEFSNSYNLLKKILNDTLTNDLLFINDEYFICSQPDEKRIIFYSIENTVKQSSIENIESINTNNCLFLIGDYIIVNCRKGISVILKEQKELIQFIENSNKYIVENNKRLSLDKNNNIYILNKLDDSDYESKQKIYIEVIKLENNNFNLIQKYNNYYINDSEKLDFVIMNENNLIVWGEGLFISENYE